LIRTLAALTMVWTGGAAAQELRAPDLARLDA